MVHSCVERRQHLKEECGSPPLPGGQVCQHSLVYSHQEFVLSMFILHMYAQLRTYMRALILPPLPYRDSGFRECRPPVGVHDGLVQHCSSSGWDQGTR